MMPHSPSPSRRQFLTAAAAGLAAAGLASAPRADEPKRGPNDKINLGFVGVGTMGRYHLGAFLGMNDVQVVAVCDVVAERRDAALDAAKKKNDGCKAYADFRQLLDSKDVDAVVIATPDHWHAIPAILAARAGKHVYCEKPLTLTIAEGRAVADAAKKGKIVFQTGSQQRSEFGGLFRKAVEYVRNGRIGKVKTVRIGVGAPAVPCDLPEQPVPDGTDWEMWNGPSPRRGYNEVLCPRGVHKHFPAWRNYREYAGGGLADMGAHHFDIAQWALEMDDSGPVKVEPPEGKDGKPATTGLRFVYANGVEMFHGGPSGCTFEGTDGTIYVDRDKIECKPEKILKEELGADAKRVYNATNHHKNWLECIRSGKEPICPAEVGHRSATVCQLGNIGYWLKRATVWDPAKEQFVGDDEANKLLSRVNREPWKL
jgi:predicted dehydrogenase